MPKASPAALNTRLLAFRLPAAMVEEIDRLRTVKRRGGLFSISVARSVFLREVIALGMETLRETRKKGKE